MNKSETQVAKYFEDQGYTVLSTGWPDLMLIRRGRYEGVATVEVKRGSDKVRPNQEEMHKALRMAGVPIYVVHPNDIRGNYRFKKIVTLEHYDSLRRQVHIMKSGVQSLEGGIGRLQRDYEEIVMEMNRIIEGIEVSGVILEQGEPDGKTKENIN